MKTIYLISLFLLSAAFVSCGGDGDDDPAPSIPDTVAPVVTINLPVTNDSVLMIQMLGVFAKITDDKILDKVRVVLTEPGGASRVLSDNQVTSYLHEIIEWHQIPKYAATGSYIVTVEAEDRGKNIKKEAVTFIVYESDLSSTAFAKPFGSAMFNPIFNEALEKLGYSYWDYGYSFDEEWFNTVMYLIVNTDNKSGISETEWNKFITDFDTQSQSWAKWDENSDGNLNETEFQKVISSLNFFNDWDKDRNKSVYFEEMADGFFSRWDSNKDSLLSREEYQEKFYTYLYR